MLRVRRREEGWGERWEARRKLCNFAKGKLLHSWLHISSIYLPGHLIWKISQFCWLIINATKKKKARQKFVVEMFAEMRWAPRVWLSANFRHRFLRKNSALLGPIKPFAFLSYCFPRLRSCFLQSPTEKITFFNSELWVSQNKVRSDWQRSTRCTGFRAARRHALSGRTPPTLLIAEHLLARHGECHWHRLTPRLDVCGSAPESDVCERDVAVDGRAAEALLARLLHLARLVLLQLARVLHPQLALLVRAQLALLLVHLLFGFFDLIRLLVRQHVARAPSRTSRQRVVLQLLESCKSNISKHICSRRSIASVRTLSPQWAAGDCARPLR